MHRICTKYLCLLILLLSNIWLFAQTDDLQHKLNNYKAKNDLTNWIYEQLDNANENPQKAISLLLNTQKERWRDAKTNEERFAWLNFLSTLGYYQLLDGNILGSINSYENALSFFRKYQILDYDVVEYILKPLSNNYTRLGDYERALYLQKQSLEFNEDNNKIATVYCNMAISYRSMARLQDAYKAIQNGLALNSDNFSRIMLNNVYADVLYDDGDYTKAATIIENNIGKQKATNEETAYWLMSAYTTSGNIYLKLQQNQKANISYLKALQLLNKYYPYGKVRERANLYTQIGETYLAQSKPLEAISYGQKTLNILGISNAKNQIIKENIYGDNKLVDVFMLLAQANLLLKQPEQTLNYINLSLLSADKIRSEFAADKTKERLQNYLKQIVEQGINISYQLYQQKKDKKYLSQILALAEQSKGRTLLDQMERNQRSLRSISKNMESVKSDSLFLRKQTLERTINYFQKQVIENPKSNLTKKIEALKFDLALIEKALAKKYQHLNNSDYNTDIQLNKLPNHRFVIYFVGKNDVYIININQQEIENVIKLSNAGNIKSAVRNFVQTYFHNGPNAMLNSPEAFFHNSNHIYQLILAPLNLKPNEKLTIIPDGILGYLSFDGLLCKDNHTENISKWPFLIKTHAIDYAFSIKTLQNRRVATTETGFAGLFITHQNSDKAVLKAISTEADLIKKQVSGNFLFNEAVNAQSFGELFEKSKVMHIGTHAYLSGETSEPTLDFGKEKLYLFDLSAKQSAPALVVLSACRTADGLLANGEGIISLSRGLNAIGTSATIASLWNVNDDAAATITANFYQSLRITKNAGEALRKAKLDWLNTPKASNALLLPYYWDSLVYIGKNQEINLHEPLSWPIYTIIGIGVIGLLILAYVFRKRILNSFSD